MWAIFEGLDKSGKGTLEKEFLKATNFKHIIIDRGPAGYLVFDTLFKRRTKAGDAEFAKNINLMRASGNFIVIYCKAPINVIKQRLKEHNETCPYDYERAQELYDAAIETLYKEQRIKVLTVNTAQSIKTCVDFIVGGLK